MNTQKIRVVKMLNMFAIGGTERQFVNIVQRLDRDRFDLHIACLKRSGAFLKDVEACGRPVTAFQINSLHSYRTVLAQLKFARYLREHQIQVVHTYGWYPNVFAIPAARWAGVPVRIASVRDTGAYSTPFRQSVQRSICRFANCVLANSDAVREWLVSEGYESQKIRVIRNGIVEPAFAPVGGEASIRSEFGLPSDAPLVGIMCRLSPVKAVNDLLDAASIVLKTHPETRFLIIGDGEERPALVAQAERLGITNRVIFTGFRTDTQQLLPQLTISALTSISEGLSNTLLESMAAGLPVVATRIGGNCEIVLDTVTGLLVPPRNTVSLADAIGRLLSNTALARQMGEQGKARIENDFSVEHAVSKTQDLYFELMDQRGNQRN